MSNIMLERREFLSGAAILGALTALGVSPTQVIAAEQGILKVRQINDIQVLDPGYLIGNAEVCILYACMPRLADPVKGADGFWNWQPSEFVESLEPIDGTHISFKLKPGLMWSDNLGELSADDVKFSFERMIKSDWASRWTTLDHVEVRDKYSGVIVLKSAFEGVWLLGLASTAGIIVPKAAVEKLEGGKITTVLPAQLGPYTMVEWTPKQRVVLKSNEAWKGSKPAFSEVHFINIENTKTAELALEAGEVSIASISLDSAARYKDNPPANTNILELPGHQYSWMGMNTENPKLADIQVRKAIQRAVDVESVLAGAYAGVSPVAHGVVRNGLLGHRTKSNYSYNPAEAKELLAAAGATGIALDIKTLAGQSEQLAAAQIIQANLVEAGIAATVTPVDSGRYWSLGSDAQGEDWKTLELWIMRFGGAPDPSDALQWFTKSQIGIWNWERWSDPEFETLWQAALAEPSSEKRGQMYVKMQDIMEETGAYVWLTFDPKFYGCRNSIVPQFEPGNDVRVELCQSAS